jgi:hypothetical protein
MRRGFICEVAAAAAAFDDGYIGDRVTYLPDDRRACCAFLSVNVDHTARSVTVTFRRARVEFRQGKLTSIYGKNV